jgi:hypothetical protein
MANEFMSRLGVLKTATLLKTERVGHPEELNQFPREYVPQWYHPYVRRPQEKNEEASATRRTAAKARAAGPCVSSSLFASLG